jgi:flagellar biosynthetic protein FliP
MKTKLPGLRTSVALLVLPAFIAAALMLLPEAAAAQGLPGITSSKGPGGSQTWSLSVQTLVLLTSLSFLPALLLSMTSFTRILIVLGLLRTAIGTQSSPPNQVLVGLSLFLTFFVMSPVFDKVHATAYKPFSENKISAEQALERGVEPFKQFMLKQTREADLALFARLANVEKLDGPEDVSLRILLPSFVISELKTAFQIGFTIFIPFLIVDLVVASVLMSMGMMMVPPATISLPFKLMLFVLVDGLAAADRRAGAELLSLASAKTTHDTRIRHGHGLRGHEALIAAGRPAAAGGPGHRPAHQPVPGRHADQ